MSPCSKWTSMSNWYLPMEKTAGEEGGAGEKIVEALLSGRMGVADPARWWGGVWPWDVPKGWWGGVENTAATSAICWRKLPIHKAQGTLDHAERVSSELRIISGSVRDRISPGRSGSSEIHCIKKPWKMSGFKRCMQKISKYKWNVRHYCLHCWLKCLSFTTII